MQVVVAQQAMRPCGGEILAGLRAVNVASRLFQWSYKSRVQAAMTCVCMGFARNDVESEVRV
jgi:hypothetical protein